jgi:hypothetical protein
MLDETMPARVVTLPIKLQLEITKELENEKYKNRTHGTRSCYAKNCHGPLCCKAERDRGGRRHEYKQERKGKTVIKKPRTAREQEVESILLEVTNWHRKQRGLEPLGQQEEAVA